MRSWAFELLSSEEWGGGVVVVRDSGIDDCRGWVWGWGEFAGAGLERREERIGGGFFFVQRVSKLKVCF